MPTSPTLSAFRLRYPAFASVPDATVQYWLTDGERYTPAWSEIDQPLGQMAYAAHHLALSGLGSDSVSGGVTSFRSASFSVSFSEKTAGQTGYSSTRYGREFLALARAYQGTPFGVMLGVL